ncbi:hypothetical protein KMT30_16025 [Streptomyces sp. IBSBF 2953]|uniref:hypothetical protein n=1 Tax=Streptomyces TaxID=1883 RepID=UPI002119D35D|nr:hypothetical protein [Streptomyces scabiei]MCQ9180513.1 hypothetical protein [Streptomyces hayashii]MDX3112294.1 hypothetical protein [Streptomyces scabiei]
MFLSFSAVRAFLVVAEALMVAAAVPLGLVIERITPLQGATLDAVVPVAPLARAS